MLPVEDEPASPLEVATCIVEPPVENSCPESVSTSLRTRSFTTNNSEMRNEEHNIPRLTLAFLQVGLTLRVGVVLVLPGTRILHKTVADVVHARLDLAELRLLQRLFDAEPRGGAPQQVVYQVHALACNEQLKT